MARKKWTPQIEVTDSLLKIREKRKWQLAYRRYVLEGAASESYAFYFGLAAKTLRQWFELQFTEGLTWDNYGKAWQFDHIVPATYFDYSNEEELRLCWSFINMRVEKLDQDKNKGVRIDLLAVKPYFKEMLARTGFSLCQKMLDKIETIEVSAIDCTDPIKAFINENKTMLEGIATLEPAEFNHLNQGMTLEEILLQKEILRKFG